MMSKAALRARRPWTRIWQGLQSSLSAKMAVIVCIGVLALVALFAYLGEAALNDNIQHSLQSRVVVAEGTARHIDYALDNVRTELTRAAQDPDFVDPSRRGRALKTAYAELEFFGSPVFVVDRHGVVIEADPPISAAVSLDSARSVQSVLAGQAFAVSRYAFPLGASVRSPLAMAALRDSSGQIVGALGLGIDLNSPHLRVFTNPIGLDGSEYMDLVDNNGIVLASTRPDRVGLAGDGAGVIAGMVQAGQSVVSACDRCGAGSAPSAASAEIVAFAPLTNVSWGLAVRQAEAEVMAGARDLQSRIFTLGAIALLGALLLVYLTTRSVIAPVQELTQAAQRIASGDLETPIQYFGRDEIGLLARAFDAMRTRVKSAIAEIQAWNQELDSRVRERTEALVAAQAQVQASRDRLQAVIDSLGDELLVIDRDLRITRVNAAVERHYAPSDHILGSLCFQVLHKNRRCEPPDCECPLARVFQTGEPCMVTHAHEDAPGTKRFYEVAASPVKDSAGRVSSVVELWRDVTAEMELQETILRRNRELSATNAIARVVGQSLKLDECLRLALEEVHEITGLDVGSIFLVEGDDRRLQLHCYYGLPKEAAEVTYRSALTDSACGGVLELGRTVVVQNVPANGNGSRHRLQQEALTSLVHVPLIAKGSPLGTLCLGTRKPRSFTEDELSLLAAIGSQIGVAVENARLYEELSRKERMRGELLRRVLSVQEDERKRIARELHDETSQTLSALRYTLDAAAKTCLTEETSPLIERVRKLTATAMDEVNKITFELRPTVLDHLGLIAALRWYANSRLEEIGTRVEVVEVGESKRLPSAVETALFRSVQEAINNVARHSGARHVQISLDFEPDQILVRVGDDGVGFDASQLSGGRDLTCGLGLMGMQERMAEVGGEFSLVSSPGEGTHVFLSVPLNRGQDESDSSARS